MTTATPPREEHHVKGSALVAKAKELLQEGNARRLIVKNRDGVVLMEVPLTVGMIGVVLEPTFAALGALAALAANYRISVEHAPEPVPGVKPEWHFHCREDV